MQVRYQLRHRPISLLRLAGATPLDYYIPGRASNRHGMSVPARSLENHATKETVMASLGNITFYAENPRALSHFWAGVFGYPPMDWDEPLRSQLLASGLTEDDLNKRGLAEDPDGKGPRLYFHHADSSKVGRNRIHLDVSVTPKAGAAGTTKDDLDAEKDRLVALGAEVVRLVEQTWGEWPERYWQMRDPEGNEFCLQ